MTDQPAILRKRLRKLFAAFKKIAADTLFEGYPMSKSRLCTTPRPDIIPPGVEDTVKSLGAQLLEVGERPEQTKCVGAWIVQQVCRSVCRQWLLCIPNHSWPI